MAIVMLMHWPEITRDQYEESRRRVRWETDVPHGARAHVAWFENDGFHVVDIWDREDDFNRFVQNRLMPVIKGEMKITSEPKVRILPAHAVFIPETVKTTVRT